MSRWRQDSGQVFPVVLALAVVVIAIALAAAQLSLAALSAAQAQTAADLAALAAARELGRRVAAVSPPTAAQRRVVQRAVRARAEPIARGSGAQVSAVTLPPRERWPPLVVEVEVVSPGPMGTEVRATAVAAVVPQQTALGHVAQGGGYDGVLVRRDGKPMCPAVARAFDRMAVAARGDGVTLVVTSAFRSDAEQAELFRRRPDPRWVARPGESRHRDATELDIGGTGAWAWLAGNASWFDFVQRYSWEPWHWGYTPGCGVAPLAGAELPSWVPTRFRELIRDASATHRIPSAALAALVRVESDFNARAVSPVGAQGIAQFMPATARAVGLRDPFDPAQAIPAAAALLSAHQARFGSFPLAFAAYNAGPGAVTRYGGIPPYPETQNYVARNMALIGELDDRYVVRLVSGRP